MTTGTDLHKMAVESAFWPLFRYDPSLAAEHKNPLQLDSKAPSQAVEEFMYRQTRFKVLRQTDPQRAEKLLEAIRGDIATRWKFFEQMANLDI
jgi:pyruvate-ferredoxin/flavodoxin oxidoreductase